MRYQGGRRKAEGGMFSRQRSCAPSTFPPPLSPLPSGVTLIELLITITIVTILSATFLGVNNVVMESAREARTKSTISKINTLLMEKWNSYATRRVDVKPILLNNLKAALAGNPKAYGQASADLRLLATRELMQLEIPDSWSDIVRAPVGSPEKITTTVLSSYPALTRIYLRRYHQVTNKTPPGTGDNTDRIIANQGAECLYLIIMNATGEGEARTLFSDQDIGDTDDDGAPEFLDGWGRPIQFIRWAPGFVERSALMSGDADADHDPVDVFKRDQINALRPGGPSFTVYGPNPIPTFIQELANETPAFRLVPLIYSAGSDGITDIDEAPYTGSIPPSSLDPYGIDGGPGNLFVTNTPNFVFGLPYDDNKDGDDNSLDNIHNHLQDNR